jgi:uncharacterized coiled-coil protein SlyX
MLRLLEARLNQQAFELATLRAAFDVQFKRIAEMQLELDRLPHARRRRQVLGRGSAEPPPHNGHGRSRA